MGVEDFLCMKGGGVSNSGSFRLNSESSIVCIAL